MTVLDRPYAMDVLFAADSRTIVSRLKIWELFDALFVVAGIDGVLAGANITDLVFRVGRSMRRHAGAEDP